MELNNLPKLKGSIRRKKRVGRGGGSGKGFHTTGRGQKGQKARKGKKFYIGFEGGQVPLYKRFPKIGGFRSPSSKDIVSVRLDKLNVFKEDTEISPSRLLEEGIIRRIPKHRIKFLAGGKLEKKFVLKGFMFSQKAREVVEKSGSKIVEWLESNV